MGTEGTENKEGLDREEERAAFTELNLREELLKGIAAMGFERAMPVQERVLKEGMGRDLIVQARTGSGITVAYGCAVLQTLPVGHRGPIMMVVCPTRELATQVAQELEELAVAMDLKAAVLNGGASFGAQRDQLQKGASLIVGTPGRIIHQLR